MEVKSRRPAKFRTVFNAIFSLILLLFVVTGNLFSPKNNTFRSPNPHRRLSEASFNNPSSNATPIDQRLQFSSTSCSGISQHEDFTSKCDFLKSNPHCISAGIFDYIFFFYCDCKDFQVLGYAVLAFWLLALFYLLGNTAADYFCCSLAKLSTLLNLPPTVAGVTLLPLGNGAPDVFAGIAAFVSNGAGEVGLNSVLGGAIFVTCIVVGSISFIVAGKNVHIDKQCFVRDIGFFLLTLSALSLIIFIGKITFWGAIMFVSIYIIYAFAIAASEILRKQAGRLKMSMVTPLLPVTGSLFSTGNEEDEYVYRSVFDDDTVTNGVPQLHRSLPKWMWASNVAIYSNCSHNDGSAENSEHLWGWNEDREEGEMVFSCSKLFSIFDFPLSFPRRLTIPVVEEERWSKNYAVASVTLSPLLLAFLWSSGESEASMVSSSLLGGFIGIAFGVSAFLLTSHETPPKKFLFPWVLGGFFMSIVWFYIVANELVTLLMALGAIFGINPSILGLTVMAWGNSMGDLISDISLALRGDDGVQIAISGCFAGPMFNILSGLGISMVIGAYKASPSSYLLPKDSSLIYTMGFLMIGLSWSLFILPRNEMQPNKLLGAGLIILYAMFLCVRLSGATGVVTFFSQD